ncbi:MAG: S8 family serine peptidase [Prevotella sp.]|nr:S8 family serine peptidase [Prevotella sp.]
MKRPIFLFFLLVMSVFSGFAQKPRLYKMSPMLRQLVVGKNVPQVCAFVRVKGDAEPIFSRHGCRELARKGDIYIVSIPTDKLSSLSQERAVSRIEARRGNEIHMDSMAIHLNATPIYEGTNLPSAFTGKGVVVGVMDIGFDLTHPNFYDASGTKYRISRLWDHITKDTIGSQFYVGRDYTTEAELLELGCCYDGKQETHGTHTLGIAAGSGYNSKYRGMAWESDICLVANATSNDIALIDSADYHKYTFATDALGFKYIFDYAEQTNQPCVISFSEGSQQDFYGYDVLYYEMLDALVGPGRILVASAGNDGRKLNYLYKERGRERVGTFMSNTAKILALTAKSDAPFTLRTTIYGEETKVIDIPTSRVVALEDSCLIDTIPACGNDYFFTVTAYPSCYIPSETCFDIEIRMNGRSGYDTPLSFEFIGEEAEIEVFRSVGTMAANSLNPSLSDAVATHNIHSPSSAPRVICVGATSYRTGITNYLGEYRPYNQGTNGQRGSYSSVGPTYDGRIKPDVMAPGTNIVSSYSSFYLENNPEARDILSDVEHFDFQGCTYAWNCNSGTSMATPAVAGAIALWLQAKPTLTPEEAMEVIGRTSRHYDPSLSYPNNLYGHGQIDAYRGLLDILGIDGIPEISTNHTPVSIVLADGQLRLKMPENCAEKPFKIAVFSTNGTLVAQFEADGRARQYDFALPTLPRGIYAVQISGNPSVGGSTLVRN